jgi:hypothetical protein
MGRMGSNMSIDLQLVQIESLCFGFVSLFIASFGSFFGALNMCDRVSKI